MPQEDIGDQGKLHGPDAGAGRGASGNGAPGAGSTSASASPQADFKLESYLAKGVRDIVGEAVRLTLKDPRESVFMARYAKASREATRRREEAEERGEHIPPFLIASITTSCNLHCTGCYARYNMGCTGSLGEGEAGTAADDVVAVDASLAGHARQLELSASEWGGIFGEARDLGIGFILLAGGEPLVRMDVMEEAGKVPQILFPVFTNGTLLDGERLDLFDRCRNLIPIFSIEGGRKTTDLRRGAGTFERVSSSIDRVSGAGLIYGVSVTVTTENVEEAMGAGFLDSLARSGCKVVFYVEYVPVDGDRPELALSLADREVMLERAGELRERYRDMLFLCFPGDERGSGGCLAAGRGFFHINPHGGVEPCPFSPYSDMNVRDASLEAAISSPLFTSLREGGTLMEDHAGGCVLFEDRRHVEELLQREQGGE